MVDQLLPGQRATRLGVAVSLARDARALGMGSRSSNRCEAGIASVRSTLTMCSTRRSEGKSAIVSTVLSQTIATFAPWSSNWCRSSLAV